MASVQKWMCQHNLKMNDDKTEFLVISSKPVSKKMSCPSLWVGDQQVLPSVSARNIGVVFDSHLSLEVHVKAVCKSSYIHIFNINKLNKPNPSKTVLGTLTIHRVTVLAN